MRILVTNWNPPSSLPTEEQVKLVEEFDKKFPIPSFMKLTRIGYGWTKKGVKMVEFYDVEEGKLEEALRIQFVREVAATEQWSGYKSEVEVLEEWSQT
jgi:hypothetical protein